MAVNAEGLPLGLELDAAAGRDRELLALARRVERILGGVPRPSDTSRDLVYSTDAQR
jgi:mandelamide amidase